ncbi:hypothetical protein AOLI_G00126600 [Acnodon oligacanthus]
MSVEPGAAAGMSRSSVTSLSTDDQSPRLPLPAPAPSPTQSHLLQKQISAFTIFTLQNIQNKGENAPNVLDREKKLQNLDFERSRLIREVSQEGWPNSAGEAKAVSAV